MKKKKFNFFWIICSAARHMFASTDSHFHSGLKFNSDFGNFSEISGTKTGFILVEEKHSVKAILVIKMPLLYGDFCVIYNSEYLLKQKHNYTENWLILKIKYYYLDVFGNVMSDFKVVFYYSN